MRPIDVIAIVLLFSVRAFINRLYLRVCLRIVTFLDCQFFLFHKDPLWYFVIILKYIKKAKEQITIQI